MDFARTKSSKVISRVKTICLAAEKVHKKACDDLIAQIVQSHEKFVANESNNFEVKAQSIYIAIISNRK